MDKHTHEHPPAVISGLGLLAAIVLAVISAPSDASEPVRKEMPELKRCFGNGKIQGTFVLYEPATQTLTEYNSKRAQQRFVPASTYKILNSLIGLETGVIKSVDQVFPWDGKHYWNSDWEQDLTLREAMKYSAVPVYQRIARDIGLARMQAGVTSANFGNGHIGQVVDRFWLDGPLAISAEEQAQFVTRLAMKQLPFSEANQLAVRDILRQDADTTYSLFAKTGWAQSSKQDLGWWVGWVEDAKGIHAFALNMDMDEKRHIEAETRKQVGRACLRQLGVIPEAKQ
ncbi:class D beta-lactamase [Burkholderiaceae bacterium DAT-1]|nr:class D beta-lactamase [Burkholderiaceae bacterium DAT-1]